MLRLRDLHFEFFHRPGGAVQVGAEHAQAEEGRRPPGVQPAAGGAPFRQGIRQGTHSH